MEMIILDTDIFIDYFRGIERAVDYIEGIPINERATTDVTLMALFKGARTKEELGNIDKFIKRNKKHFEFLEGLKADLPSYRRNVVEG